MIKRIFVVLCILVLAFSLVGCNKEDDQPKVEEFQKEYFTESFFEQYTLVLVPFVHPTCVCDHVIFHTTFIENGKINFLIEVTKIGSDRKVTNYTFAVIIPNEILKEYEIGATEIFHTYALDDSSSGEVIENCRERLNAIEKKDFRVGFIAEQSGSVINSLPNATSDVVVISNMKTFNDVIESANWRSVNGGAQV